MGLRIKGVCWQGMQVVLCPHYCGAWWWMDSLHGLIKSLHTRLCWWLGLVNNGKIFKHLLRTHAEDSRQYRADVDVDLEGAGLAAIRAVWSRGLVWYMDGSTRAGSSGADVWNENREKVILFNWCAYGHVPGRNLCDFSLCKGMYTKGLCKWVHIYICLHSQPVLWALEVLNVMSKLVWECRQALYAVSSRNKVTLFWVPGDCGIQVTRIWLPWLGWDQVVHSLDKNQQFQFNMCW
jgi:hypothetical protein